MVYMLNAETNNTCAVEEQQDTLGSAAVQPGDPAAELNIIETQELEDQNQLRID